MKKYIKPAIVKVMLDNESILAASITVDNTPINVDDVGANDIEFNWDEE